MPTTAIITGASSGIGWALAHALAGKGTRLVLTARSADKLSGLASSLQASGGEALAVPADITVAADRSRLIEATVSCFGSFDILINNAGVGASGFFKSASEDRLRRIFEINFFAATELTRLAIPHLERGCTPMIVNISSVIGKRGVPGYSEYCASKFAMNGWSEALRAELVRQGIHVLLVCPGRIETPFGEHQLESKFEYRWQSKPKMSAERCAQIIVRAMRRRKNEVLITAEAKLLATLARFVPRTLDRLLARHARDA